MADVTAALASFTVEVTTKADAIVRAAKRFVHYYETWEQFQELKGSISTSIPTEFMELCEAVEDFYGSPETEDEAAEWREDENQIKCLHGAGYYRYGLEPQAYCHGCDQPVDESNYRASEYKGIRYRTKGNEEANGLKSRILLIRERAICRDELSRAVIRETSQGRLDDSRWEDRTTGVVEAEDAIYVPTQGKETGRFYTAEDLYAINHPVTLFYRVVKRKEKATREK